MEGIRKIDLKNLVLKVDANYDHSIINLNEWQDYLDCLCGDREYQKEAIKTETEYADYFFNEPEEYYDENVEIFQEYHLDGAFVQ